VAGFVENWPQQCQGAKVLGGVSRDGYAVLIVLTDNPTL